MLYGEGIYACNKIEASRYGKNDHRLIETHLFHMHLLVC